MTGRVDQRRVPAESRMSSSRRRQQIRATAAELFDRLGYAQTSMDRIAEEVGIRKPSLYYYFPSKDSLLVEMHDEMIEHILAAHERRKEDSTATASDLVLGIMTDVISLQESHPGSLRIFFEHYRELPEPERDRILQRRKLYEQELREQLQRGIDNGEFADTDVRFAGFAILGMANWTYQWFRPEGSARSEEVARMFWQMLTTGIRPDGETQQSR